MAHLLRRAGFGGRKAEIDALMTRPSWSAVVDKVLDTTANPADVTPAAVETRDVVDQGYAAWSASVHYWMDRMATSPTPIVEKMTLFWHGHLTSSVVEAELPRLVHRQIQMYRALGLGDLHTLFQSMAVDPAMLRYLNNGTSRAGAPNENFGRELMELFALGRGNYTESDVTAMARAWTGHNLTDDKEQYLFRPTYHDNGDKTLFGITKNWNGPEAMTELIRGSKATPVARHIARSVWSFFAYPDPADALVNDLAAIFLYTGLNIKYLLKAVFLRPEFRLASTRNALVRSPIEWMAATMRHAGLDSATVQPNWWMERMGQRLYAPPNVAGWPRNAGWISSSAQWAKGNFAGYVRFRCSEKGLLDATNAMTPAATVSYALAQFGVDQPSALTRQKLEAYVVRERASARGYAVPWNIVALIMLSPDFQLA